MRRIVMALVAAPVVSPIPAVDLAVDPAVSPIPAVDPAVDLVVPAVFPIPAVDLAAGPTVETLVLAESRGLAFSRRNSNTAGISGSAPNRLTKLYSVQA